MSYSDEVRDVQVKQLSGPGVPGLETDPPVFHFDLGMDLMPELVADPVGFLRGLGLGPDQGVAPKGSMTVRLTSPEWAWDGSRWVAQEDQPVADDAGAPDAGTHARSSCCYISGPEEMTCHTHQDPVVV
jgi:hypothetical protein